MSLFCSCLQKELALNGARLMGIDVSRQILIVSGKVPGVGGEHVLSKVCHKYWN